MGRRNHLIRMRIAEVLADREWKSAAEIVHHFLEEGWAFTSANQISTICRITGGIEQRKTGLNAEITYRLSNPQAFYDYMARDGLSQKPGVRHRNHESQIKRVLSPARPLSPSDE
tara:strand:- start:72 stop:416 length:345 start_codon:yes stop_codon:yes gene_type:complete